jgi:hypothetical protein
VYWRRPEEWAAAVEAWVEATGQRGSVLTLYEIAEGDAAASQGGCRHRSLGRSLTRGRVSRHRLGAAAQVVAGAGQARQGADIRAGRPAGH